MLVSARTERLLICAGIADAVKGIALMDIGAGSGLALEDDTLGDAVSNSGGVELAVRIDVAFVGVAGSSSSSSRDLSKVVSRLMSAIDWSILVSRLMSTASSSLLTASTADCRERDGEGVKRRLGLLAIEMSISLSAELGANSPRPLAGVDMIGSPSIPPSSACASRRSRSLRALRLSRLALITLTLAGLPDAVTSTVEAA